MAWQILGVTVVAIVVLLLPFALLYLRRRWLTGQGGLFDCALQVSDALSGPTWVLGVARYRGENLEWFRSFSLSLSPKHVFPRAATTYVDQRAPEGLEVIALFEDAVIVTVRDRVHWGVHSLSMNADDALGLMSWLESAPPGSHYLPSSASTPR